MGSLSGQSPDHSLQTLNSKIDYFLEETNEDSFLVYTSQKLLLTRKLDRLGDWVETYVDLKDYYRQDNLKALQFLDEALRSKWRDPKNPDEWEQFLYLYTFQGYHLSQLSRIWPAVQAYESARTLYEKHRFPDYEAGQWLYKPLGNHYTRLGDNEKALAVFQTALLQPNNPEELAGFYVNIALAYWNSGKIQPAQSHCEKGLGLKGISPSKRSILLGTLAMVRFETGSFKEAAELSDQALHLLGTPAANDVRRLEDRARLRRTAGMAYTRLWKFAEAKRLLDGALSDARRVWGNGLSRDIGKIELAIAEWHLIQNQPHQAVKAANRALSSVLPGFKPKTDFENPRPEALYEENTLFEALLFKAKAAGEMGFMDNKWLLLSLECHDLAYLAEMRLRAVYQYESSKLELQTSSREREEAAMEVVRNLYQRYPDSPVYIKKGLEIAERSKATLLMEALHENLALQHHHDPELLQTLVSLRRMAAWYKKQRILEPNSPSADQWRIDLDVVQREINAYKERIPGLDLFESAGNHFAPAAFQFTDEVVLEYFVSKHVTDVFTCNQNGVVDWKWIEHDEVLHQNIIRFRAYFSDGDAILNDPEGYLETAFQLYERLLPSGFCRTTQRLVIVPDGYLHFIPFEALVSAKPDENTSLRNAAYLVTNQQVWYAWSIQSMNTQNALHSRAGKAVLGVAPGFAGKERGLAPITPGKKEWSTLGFGVVHALSDKAATLDRFMSDAGNYRVLHLSTHAFAGGSANEVPRIELFDQSMLLSDVYALPLQADLVVLSACETGMGENVKGEGVMSLARAFAHAGAACVVSSLWTVNDQTTASLMGGFYRHLKSGQSIGASLRQAKLDYINDPEVPAVRQSPYFWAGMVEVGSDRIIDVPNAVFLSILAGAVVLLVFLLLMFYLLKKNKNTLP